MKASSVLVVLAIPFAATAQLEDIEPMMVPVQKPKAVAKEETGRRAERQPKSVDVDFCAFDAKGDIVLYGLTLENADGGNADVSLKVWCRGGVFGMAWFEKPSWPGYACVAQAAFGGFYNVPPDGGLTRKGDTLTGTVYRGFGEKFILDMKVDGRSITGAYRSEMYDARLAKTYHGWVLGRFFRRQRDATQPLKPIPGPRGAVKGTILNETELKSRLPPVPPAAQYPCWRNKGDGIGFETGARLVTDLSQVRVIWKSEELIPPGYHEGINFGTAPCGIQAGHASPILADGKIFLNYFTGSAGRADDDRKGYDEFILKSGHIPDEQVARKIARVADQIMACMDAQTGRTLWKFVAKEDGPNISRGGSDSRHKLCGPSSKAASHLTGCYGDGRVYFKGTGGVIYCLDADTGKLVWQTGPWDRNRRSSAGTDTCQYADGVMATNADGGLSGFDGATGKKLWTVRGAVGSRRTHIRWAFEGNDYFITPGGQLLDPKTGDVLWTAKPASDVRYGRMGAVAADGTYMIHGSGTAITGFRISRASVEKLWETSDMIVWRAIHPVMYRGHAYVRAMKKGARGPRTYCIEMKTGKVVGEASGTKSFSSVIGGDGRIFNSNAAIVFMQNAEPQDFSDFRASGDAPCQVVADASMRVVLQGMPESTAIYADGRLWSRTFDGIICYDLRALNSEETARFEAAGKKRVEQLAKRLRDADALKVGGIASSLLATGSSPARDAVQTEIKTAFEKADAERFGSLLGAVGVYDLEDMPGVLPLVVAVLKGKDRAMVACGLSYAPRLKGTKALKSIKPLISNMLTERDSGWWEPAIATLAVLDPSGMSTVRPLMEIAGDRDKARRRRAALLLGGLATEIPDKAAARKVKKTVIPILEEMALVGDRASQVKRLLGKLQGLDARGAADDDVPIGFEDLD